MQLYYTKPCGVNLLLSSSHSNICALNQPLSTFTVWTVRLQIGHKLHNPGLSQLYLHVVHNVHTLSHQNGITQLEAITLTLGCNLDKATDVGCFTVWGLWLK